jgi:hypothetical protein
MPAHPSASCCVSLCTRHMITMRQVRAGLQLACGAGALVGQSLQSSACCHAKGAILGNTKCVCAAPFGG